MTKTTMNNNATINCKSTCGARKTYHISGKLCANGMHPDDKKNYIKNDGTMRKNALIGDIEKANIIEMKRMGYTDLKVSQETCRSIGTIYKVKKEAKMVHSRETKPQQNEIMINLREMGVQVTKIAEAFGVSPQTVYYHTKGCKAKRKFRVVAHKEK